MRPSETWTTSEGGVARAAAGAPPGAAGTSGRAGVDAAAKTAGSINGKNIRVLPKNLSRMPRMASAPEADSRPRAVRARPSRTVVAPARPAAADRRGTAEWETARTTVRIGAGDADRGEARTAEGGKGGTPASAENAAAAARDAAAGRPSDTDGEPLKAGAGRRVRVGASVTAAGIAETAPARGTPAEMIVAPGPRPAAFDALSKPAAAHGASPGAAATRTKEKKDARAGRGKRRFSGKRLTLVILIS